MPSVETIYQESVMPLPISDQVRLAELILKRAPRETAPKRRSALEIIEAARAVMPHRTAAEIDEYIRTERDSWDD